MLTPLQLIWVRKLRIRCIEFFGSCFLLLYGFLFSVKADFVELIQEIKIQKFGAISPDLHASVIWGDRIYGTVFTFTMRGAPFYWSGLYVVTEGAVPSTRSFPFGDRTCPRLQQHSARAPTVGCQSPRQTSSSNTKRRMAQISMLNVRLVLMSWHRSSTITVSPPFDVEPE